MNTASKNIILSNNNAVAWVGPCTGPTAKETDGERVFFAVNNGQFVATHSLAACPNITSPERIRAHFDGFAGAVTGEGVTPSQDSFDWAPSDAEKAEAERKEKNRKARIRRAKKTAAAWLASGAPLGFGIMDRWVCSGLRSEYPAVHAALKAFEAGDRSEATLGEVEGELEGELETWTDIATNGCDRREARAECGIIRKDLKHVRAALLNIRNK